MSTIHDMHTQHFGGLDTETIRVECMERAAPAMLDALKGLVECWKEFDWGNQWEAYNCLAKCAQEEWKAAEAAITEAEGRDV